MSTTNKFDVMMHHEDIPIFTGDVWLANLLEYAATAKVCVSWGCTTCGSRPFRNALIQSAQSTGKSDLLCEIAGQLGKVAVNPEHIEAIRFIIMFLNVKASSIAFNEQLLPLFAGSPAEGVYCTMVTHHESTTLRRHAHELRNDPDEIKRRKQQRADEKRARLAERAKRKTEIDQVWRTRTNKKPID